MTGVCRLSLPKAIAAARFPGPTSEGREAMA